MPTLTAAAASDGVGLPSLGEHQLLVFWAQLLVIVLTARLLGGLARRVGQPAVVGELAAGMVLGPSILGALWPAASEWLFPADPTQAAMLNTVGWLGVAFLLILTGFETDLAIIRRLGRAAALVSVGGLVVPFGIGLAVGAAMPSATFVPDGANRLAFVLFIATALSISSLPVIAKILAELGLMRRNFGQVTVAVGMANDVVGWLLLGAVAGIAREGGFDLAQFAVTLAAMAVLLVGSLTLGQRGADRALRWTRARSDSPVDALAVTLALALVAAVFAQAAHIEAVLGVFVAGVVLGRSRFQHPDVEHHLEAITRSLLAPVFFATAGLRLDLAALADLTVLGWSVVVLAVAVVGKLAGAYVGALAARMERREGLALGVGLNARGAVEVVIATVGLSVGALNAAAYTAIVLMAIVTSMMAPPMLRRVVRGWRGTEEERERLEREETLARNLIVKPGRLLLPSRGGTSSIVAAQILNFAFPEEAGVTVLSVGPRRDVDVDLTLDPVCTVLEGRDVELRHVDEEDAVEAILAEAKLAYDAIVVGAREGTTNDADLLSPVVDRLLLATRVPVVIVRKPRNLDRPTPPAFTRALVPVSGTPGSRRAQEIAFHLSKELGTEVVLAHVVTRPTEEVHAPSPATAMSRGNVAAGLMDTARALAADVGVEARTTVRAGTSPATELLAEASDAEADLIITGATVRKVEGRPFLGDNVEHLLATADATVVVVAVPDTVAPPVRGDGEAETSGEVVEETDSRL